MGFVSNITNRIKPANQHLDNSSSDGEIVHKFDELTEYNEQYPEPTTEDYATLPKKLGHAPYKTYLICLIEFAERASYYGVKGRLNNFIQLPLPKDGNGAGAPPKGTQKNAGALGLGLRTASAVTLLLTFLAYLTPLYGGYISDKKYGRVKTIWLGVWVGAISHIILIIAAIPSVIKGGAALAPTIIAILTLALGTGFIKPNLLPLLYDQYEHKRDIVKTKENGERVIELREPTLERMTLVFYWSINVGAFLSLATAYCAKLIGFWLAYLIPGIIYFIMVPVLLILAPKLKKETPNGLSIVEETFKVIKYALKGGWIKRLRSGEFWEYAKPSNIVSRGDVQAVEAVNKKGKKKVSWNDQFVNDVWITIDACKIFLFFIIYNITDGGIGGIENSQANSMTTNGVPNDLIDNFNPLTIIVFIPFLDYVLYPILRKYNIEFRPVHRMFFGFILAAISQVAGAIIQWKVYESSPCGYYATDCDVGTGVSPISVWVEVVLYVLGAASECFANTAAYEIAYTRAPEHMKGLVMALFLFMQSISAAISEAATSALIDPHLIWPFVACAIVGFVSAVYFLWLYKDLHIIMERERIEKENLLKKEYEEYLNAKEFDEVEGDKDKTIEKVVSKDLSVEDHLIETKAVESNLETKK
ncbi:Peptide transporter [Wickerhamomyces ciferrii]|uniref:Peptide transporter n=1 Tax=Wickerhamomyces ciferrii (strain ATCC 14091 / BCRC 22168 / CBS 111 / JCM 3599 / NBRC 0793 / NRRL Y-1031 F-60-10) TaxID=1206466 RepID=K0KN70_WICCF|nr:Peptide transporter [Wickerhamomyces ciferrii]CCH42578.1 Peptide transporter [Wickerhamomyces ciferrii]